MLFRSKVVPDYVCLGTRTLQDNGSWLAALTRPQVDLVTDPIDHLEADAIVTADGARHEVDQEVVAGDGAVGLRLLVVTQGGADALPICDVASRTQDGATAEPGLVSAPGRKA